MDDMTYSYPTRGLEAAGPASGNTVARRKRAQLSPYLLEWGGKR